MQEKSSDTQPVGYTLVILLITLMDCFGQVVPKPNSSAKYPRIFFFFKYKSPGPNHKWIESKSPEMSPGNFIIKKKQTIQVILTCP